MLPLFLPRSLLFISTSERFPVSSKVKRVVASRWHHGHICRACRCRLHPHRLPNVFFLVQNKIKSMSLEFGRCVQQTHTFNQQIPDSVIDEWQGGSRTSELIHIHFLLLTKSQWLLFHTKLKVRTDLC